MFTYDITPQIFLDKSQLSLKDLIEPKFYFPWGGRVVRWYWEKLPVPGRPTIWITVGQGPAALAVGAGGGCLDIFTLNYPFFLLSPSLWETARYRLKYCLKGPLNPKPTNQFIFHFILWLRNFRELYSLKK